MASFHLNVAFLLHYGTKLFIFPYDVTDVNTFLAGEVLCLSMLVMLKMTFLPYKGKKLLKGSETEKNSFTDIFTEQPNDLTDDLRKLQ